MNPARPTPRPRGFTLIELLITVVIVGLLAALTVPMAEVSVQRNREQALREALQQIRTAIDAYKQAVDEGRILGEAQKSGYPPNLQTLVDGAIDAKSPNRETKIFFLRHLPRDPFADDSTQAAEATWGKRSYASTADDPQEGEDVFDVYSQDKGSGLNGIPYRQW